MKTQAWGWLAAAVLAAGLNASYHDGGLEWAHRAVAQVSHHANAVMALATGRADQFMAEAQIIRVGRSDLHGSPSCAMGSALARMQSSLAQRSESEFNNFETMSARQEAQIARLEATRAKFEARFADFKVPAADFNPVEIRAPRIVCPRVRARIPQIRIPATPVVHLESSGLGPI